MTNVPNPGYADQRKKRMTLRIVGVVCMTIAVVLIVIALVDFFRAFGSGDVDAAPTRFWMFFAAMPFFLVGGIGLQGGFMGAAARFGAGETMPVVKDTAAYLTDGEGVLGVGRTVARAPGAQQAPEPSPQSASGPYCRSCGQRNDADARFCDRCGQSLA